MRAVTTTEAIVLLLDGFGPGFPEFDLVVANGLIATAI